MKPPLGHHSISPKGNKGTFSAGVLEVWVLYGVFLLEWTVVLSIYRGSQVMLPSEMSLCSVVRLVTRLRLHMRRPVQLHDDVNSVCRVWFFSQYLIP
ncbi:hypothetical protein JTE90_019248 [Oedothorax gibbosus]|uniref:Uncharacterized protein n=1 Tax=Oedothorax gibbosus TaxID=931172 RepID=A0AAV6UT75_9ARAC|nr:hypothetical protein JTE90_019248 [Oedothorax gibbosus]